MDLNAPKEQGSSTPFFLKGLQNLALDQTRPVCLGGTVADMQRGNDGDLFNLLHGGRDGKAWGRAFEVNLSRKSSKAGMELQLPTTSPLPTTRGNGSA